jgi:site-specific recombinase XerD
MTALAPTLQAWFTDRLTAQRNASPHTIAAYRDTLRLLLDYAEHQLGHQPCQLDIAEIDASLIAGFLDHLEHERANSIRTRNLRLAAIHSLFRYAQHRTPSTPKTSSACSQSQPSAPNVRSSRSSTKKRSRRCSMLPTGLPGPADATTLCS